VPHTFVLRLYLARLVSLAFGYATTYAGIFVLVLPPVHINLSVITSVFGVISSKSHRLPCGADAFLEPLFRYFRFLDPILGFWGVPPKNTKNDPFWTPPGGYPPLRPLAKREGNPPGGTFWRFWGGVPPGTPFLAFLDPFLGYPPEMAFLDPLFLDTPFFDKRENTFADTRYRNLGFG